MLWNACPGHGVHASVYTYVPSRPLPPRGCTLCTTCGGGAGSGSSQPHTSFPSNCFYWQLLLLESEACRDATHRETKIVNVKLHLPHNRTITTRIFATKQIEKFQVISRCYSIRNRTAVNKMLRESKSNQITGENFRLPLVTNLPLKRKNLQQTLHDNIRKKHNKQKPSPRFSFSQHVATAYHIKICTAVSA
jgi:hypothetical protein